MNMFPNFNNKHLVRIKNPHSIYIERLMKEPVVEVKDRVAVPYFCQQKAKLDSMLGMRTIKHNDILLFRRREPRIVAKFKKHTWFE